MQKIKKKKVPVQQQKVENELSDVFHVLNEVGNGHLLLEVRDSVGTLIQRECRLEIPSWKMEEQANQNNRVEGIIPPVTLRRPYKCG